MQDNQHRTEDGKVQTFTKRLDFYWKFISVYTIAIILYSLLKGTIVEWTVTVVLLDPVVILLVIIIIYTYISLIVDTSKKVQLVIGNDYFILSNKFRQRKFTSSEITKIIIHKEIIRGQGRFRVIKVRLRNKKRIMRIRPLSYWKDTELLQAFATLKKNINS